MYMPVLARRLRERAHDVVSAEERGLLATPDTVIFEAMRVEGRAILTNNVVDYMPIVNGAMANGLAHSGVVFTSDRSLPRNKSWLGAYIEALDALMCCNPDDNALLNQVRWLMRPT